MTCCSEDGYHYADCPARSRDWGEYGGYDDYDDRAEPVEDDECPGFVPSDKWPESCARCWCEEDEH